MLGAIRLTLIQVAHHSRSLQAFVKKWFTRKGNVNGEQLVCGQLFNADG